jgi:hypothetical protein
MERTLRTVWSKKLGSIITKGDTSKVLLSLDFAASFEVRPLMVMLHGVGLLWRELEDLIPTERH